MSWQYCVREQRSVILVFFFQAEDGIRDLTVTGVQTCALPISAAVPFGGVQFLPPRRGPDVDGVVGLVDRSEEHTSELQSQSNLVCRLLLEKKKKKHKSDDLLTI